MYKLFATESTGMLGGLLPADFFPGLIGTIIYFLVAMLLFPVAYKVVDWITPGDLSKQLLGTDVGQDGKPNQALAIVVGGLFLGMCVILAAAIH